MPKNLTLPDPALEPGVQGFDLSEPSSRLLSDLEWSEYDRLVEDEAYDPDGQAYDAVIGNRFGSLNGRGAREFGVPQKLRSFGTPTIDRNETRTDEN